MLSKHAIQVTAEYTYTDQVIKFEIIIDIKKNIRKIL